MYYGNETKEIKLPKGHPSFYHEHVVKEPLYVKIVKSFTYEKPSQILTSGYHRGGTFFDGYQCD